MRNGNALANVRRDILLAVQHALDVRRIDIAALDEQLAGRLDGFFLGYALEADLDVFFRQDTFLERFLSSRRIALRDAFTLEAGRYDVIDVVLREILDPDVLGLRAVFERALRELLMGNDKLGILRDVAEAQFVTEISV